MSEGQGAPAPPSVWVLLGKGTGGNGQMRSLAEALGWPYETKQLVHNRLNRCPNALLGASLATLDRKQSSPLTPPWPDLVIAASRRSAPVALWIRQRSGGRTRLVHLLHTQAPLALFDLIITMPQYCLPERANVLQLTAPLNRIPVDRLIAAASRWAQCFKDLPRPYTALMAGGNSSSYELDPATASRLGREASAHVRAHGGSLLLSTSPRTPPAAADALLQAIDCPAYRYRWRPNDEANPYLGYIALADDFIVTADSASLLVEACATGKPVTLFEWPPKIDGSRGLKRLWRRWSERRRGRADEAGATAHLYDWLVYTGLVKPPRDFAAYHRALMSRGLVTRLGNSRARTSTAPLDDMARAVERIRRLFADR